MTHIERIKHEAMISHMDAEIAALERVAAKLKKILEKEEASKHGK